MARERKRLEKELVVSEIKLSDLQVAVLNKRRSFVPGPPNPKLVADVLDKSLQKLENIINKRFSEAFEPQIIDEAYVER